jgi:antitoxin (DNA-binding transcriptional repressor) of toxin-antitoxin stability system
MEAHISVSELERDLPAILDRVRSQGDTFVIEQGGMVVAALGPAMRATTWSDLVDALQDLPERDPDFADDLEQIQRQQPGVPDDAWPG